jgi:hypothetical protein
VLTRGRDLSPSLMPLARRSWTDALVAADAMVGSCMYFVEPCMDLAGEQEGREVSLMSRGPSPTVCRGSEMAMFSWGRPV